MATSIPSDIRGAQRQLQSELNDLASRYADQPDVQARIDRLSDRVATATSEAAIDRLGEQFVALEDRLQTSSQAPHRAAQDASQLSRQITQQASSIQSAAARTRLVNQSRKYATQAATASSAAKVNEALAGLEATLQQTQEEVQLQRAAARQKHRSQRESFGQRINSSHLVRASGKERQFADLLVTLGASTLTVLWTASRNHSDGSDILWAIFWTGLGSVMAVEGNGELAYAGFGVAGADMAYLALRLTGGIQSKAF